ncbi:MAG: NAD-dependent epimerase/dehydratase family protein [Candidatus Omnitrophica bacterium]|nr:NAD-dependent epimerase/dehydratase family protein [Candidatus Omnitrophota bacterium]
MIKNILIAGGAGFVGSNLALNLKQELKGCRIICFDNLIRAGSELNIPRLEDCGITFIKGDIRNLQQLLDLPKIDLIVECSAEPSVLASYDNPSYTIETNLMGTLNCLELARRDKSGFIFLSTSRVYPVEQVNNIPYEEQATRFDWLKRAEGAGYSYRGVNLDFSLNGVKSLYGATKLSSEQLVLEFADMYSFKCAINRLGVIAGPWQMGKIDQGIVGYWMARHKYRGALSYVGFDGLGKQVRDIVHVDDVCALILYQINHLDGLDRKIFNAGGGRDNSVSLLELTDMVRKITGNTIAIGSVRDNRKADIRIFIADNSAVSRETGWAPQKSIEDILVDVNQWMDTHADELKGVLT